jgi:MFS family permease
MSAPDSHPPAPHRRTLLEVVIASTIGTTIEWYDFFLYGFAAASIFRGLYFPTLSPFFGQIVSFLTFTGGFVARPLGGIIFGYLGDRVGRKATMVATLLLMGVSTVLVGCLPTYNQIGVAAPVLLASLRFIQGLGVGGEWGGSVLLAVEYGHRGRRGFLASWPQAGVPLGLLTSIGALALCERSLTPAQYLSWGWRIPFLLSGVLIVVGLVIRVRLLETPLFAELKDMKGVATAPVRETLRLHWREVLLAAGTRLTENACFYLFTIYLLTYGPNVLHVGNDVVYLAVSLGGLAEVVAMPVYGVLSDHWSRRGAYITGCLVLIAFAWPYYVLLHTGEPVWIVTATVAVLVAGHAVLYSVQGSLIPELFGTRLRYTGASLGYQLAAPFAGGLAPIIAVTLVEALPGHYWPLVAYVVVISVVSLVSVLFVAETSRKDLRAPG